MAGYDDGLVMGGEKEGQIKSYPQVSGMSHWVEVPLIEMENEGQVLEISFGDDKF